MTDDLSVQKAQQAAKYLRQHADEAADSMGERQLDFDAAADVAEVVLDLAVRASTSP
jgi:hypothetical protein